MTVEPASQKKACTSTIAGSIRRMYHTPLRDRTIYRGKFPWEVPVGRSRGMTRGTVGEALNVSDAPQT